MHVCGDIESALLHGLFMALCYMYNGTDTYYQYIVAEVLLVVLLYLNKVHVVFRKEFTSIWPRG